MNKILVVGSTGKVGRALIEELARAGEQVRAATRNPAKMNASDNVEPVLFDYADPATFATALEGSNRVFLMAPQEPSDIAPDEFMLPFLEAAAQGKRKVVLMSSLSAEFDASFEEPLRQVELALKRSGLPFVILQPNWFMDNFHTLWLPPIKEAGVMPLPAADSRCSFVDSRDVAASAAAALRTDRLNGRALALTGPESLTHGEVAAVLSKAAGREIQYVPVDDASFTKSMVDAGLPGDYANYVTGLFHWTRAEKIAAETSSAVEELTGRAPRSLAQYAQDHASAWK